MMKKVKKLALTFVLLCASLSAFTLNPSEREVVIVLPQGNKAAPAGAARELAKHFELATGVKPAIVEKVPAGAFAFVIQSADEKTAKSLRLFGARIECDENAMVISGNDFGGEGTLFAVYEWLDKALGCRWLWPGDLGTVVPKCKTVEIKTGRWDYHPVLKLTCWRPAADNRNLWDSFKGWEHFFSHQQEWFYRNRIFNDVSLQQYPHGFEDWYSRFSGEHPEWFQLLPNGKRAPDALYEGGAPQVVSMCVSNQEYVKKVVQEYLRTFDARLPMINVNENDTAGRCTCDACLAADDSPIPAAERRAIAKAHFDKGDESWWRALGSLSNRYAKFYMAVLAEIDRVAPERKAELAGLIYANYSEPPTVKMSPRIYQRFCPPIMFPWAEDKIAKFERIWDGWHKTGCQMIMRPNFTLDGHCYPINYSKDFSRCFRFAYSHGLIGLDMDSCTGEYPVQGTTIYTIARIMCNPELSDEDILNEYYSAFGKAAEKIRQYFDETAKLSARFKEKETQQNASIVGGDFTSFLITAPAIFTSDVFTKLTAILAEAHAAADDDITKKRVEYLQMGLKHAELAANTQHAFEKYSQTHNIKDFAPAFLELNKYRADHEKDLLANIGFLRFWENRRWPSKAEVKMLLENNLQLPIEWDFRLDRDNVGINEKWYSLNYVKDAQWRKIRTDAPWEGQIGEAYDGYAWYRLEFDFPENYSGSPIIIFGAVDEACKVWCNGSLLYDRPFPYKGDLSSWETPFEVNLRNAVFPGKKNVIMVRVEDKSGAGGIWKPCYLKIK